MLDRIVGSAVEAARRRVPRDSATWSALSRIWAAWRAGDSLYRKNPLLRNKWARNEQAFEAVLRAHSETKPDFFVVQIGACDGLMADPIHKWIEDYQWHGVLVEPQAVEFARLSETYAAHKDRLAFEKAAITPQDGPCELYRVNDDALSSEWERGIASVLPQTDSDRFVKERVEGITFDTLVQRHGIRRIDLLQIDVEGFDFEVLKLVDFGSLPPALIRYEHRHLRPKDKLDCQDLLTSRGYSLLEMEFDTAAVRSGDQA